MVVGVVILVDGRHERNIWRGKGKGLIVELFGFVLFLFVSYRPQVDDAMVNVSVREKSKPIEVNGKKSRDKPSWAPRPMTHRVS